MDIRQLRYFVAVAEERSFSRAALRLNVTQPPLSVQIKALERDLGVRLLDRDRRSVALTAVGAVFLDHAHRALREFDLARSAVRLASEGATGLVRIGYTSSVSMLAPFTALIGAFRAGSPGIKLEMRHMSTAQQLKALAAADLDVGFLRPPIFHRPGDDLRMIPVWRDELMVFMSETDPLAAHQSPIELSVLAGRNVVAISADVGCGVHEQATALWRAAGVMPHIVQEARELRTVLGLAASGIGVAILPSCFQQAGVANVRAKALVNSGVESGLMMTYGVGIRSASTDKLIAHFEGWTRTALPQYVA